MSRMTLAEKQAYRRAYYLKNREREIARSKEWNRKHRYETEKKAKPAKVFPETSVCRKDLMQADPCRFARIVNRIINGTELYGMAGVR